MTRNRFFCEPVSIHDFRNYSIDVIHGDSAYIYIFKYDALRFQLITYWRKLCRLFEYPACVETAEERNYPNIRGKDILALLIVTL